ncbi:lipoprotein insertase outer membrane protein LolB [Pseudoalteromonas citrea]|uniref:lipoprotein insertase outer membrane protein LolB n=1 Tax=Pseudoalteromonas citrea TaxID=43655 RepID=UPI000A028805|nr:lipoprotein insertase outer membrane protein LolB [Pseudoalteromonas citrea]
MTQFHLILLMFFLFISGCAQKISPIDSENPQWKNQLKEQTNWHARGKLAFISPQERQSANFNWQLSNDKQHLILTSFIGTRLLELTEHKDYSELSYDGKIYKDDNSSALIKRLSGFTLPMSQAPYWLTGTVVNDTNEYDDQQRLIATTWVDPQGQVWHAKYQTYKLYEKMWLPSRMTLSHQNLTVKLQLNEWQF